MKPVFGSLTPSMIEKPTIAKMFWTCGICLSNASMRLTASRVRLTDAPSGNCIEMKKAPWSSSGRNPVGVRKDRR